MNIHLPEELKEERLPRRDWILLPLISLATILILTTSTELIARRIYTHSTTYAEEIMKHDSSSTSLGGVPNSVIWAKIEEGEPIEYRLNGSGYRSDTDFGPKAPGTFRIVAIGSSMVMGLNVPIARAFATTLSPELSQRSGKKVEVINEGMAGEAALPLNVKLRFHDALAAQPDLILRVITPWDIQHQIPSSEMNDQDTAPHARDSNLTKSITNLNGHIWHVAFMLQHVLYQSESQYLNAYLINGDKTYDSGFLRNEFDDEWMKQLQQFDSDDAEIQQRVQAAGVPMITVLMPIRPQAAMISQDEWPAGYNPYKLDDELRSIVTRHGGSYIDILPDLRNIPDSEQGYFPIEGHLNVRGHVLISQLLAKALTNGVVPSLKAINPQQRAQEPQR